ncbi:MAG: YwiC-like family protein [Acidimicrobiia bacterium]|nr:YwiC-like family protein [Acidimicrobiia bacterium]
MTEPATVNSSRTRWRSIALPTEHGGWGFTLEPILLGLLVAPSPAAWELSVAALAVFLARRPTKLVITDLVRRRWLRRTSVALGFVGGYGALALAGLAGAVVTAEAAFWSPLLVAAPLAAIALYADSQSQSRGLVPEIAGSSSMGATVAMIALADGWEPAAAFGLWAVLVARAVTTVVLVRGQIRRVHGRPVGAGRIYATQGLTVLVVAAGAAAEILPWLSVIAIAAIGLVAYVSLQRPPAAARVVGWTQITVGLCVVLLTAVGIRAGW